MHHLNEEIKWIKSLESGLACNAELAGQTFDAYLEKKPRGYGLALPRIPGFEAGSEIALKLESQDISLEVDGAYIKKMYGSVAGGRGRFGAEAHLDRFSTAGLCAQASCYHKKLLPAQDHNLFWHVVDTQFVPLGSQDTVAALTIELKASGAFLVCAYKNEETKYLVIESQQQMALDSFEDCAWDILVAVGYLTGHLVQDESYTFFYAAAPLSKFDGFAYTTHRKSLKYLYTPVYTNPYSWLRKDRARAKYFEGKLKPVGSAQFNFLCNLIHTERDFAAAILLFIEAAQSSLLVMPVSLAVCLECLSEFTCANHPGAPKPIASKDKAKTIIRSLLGSLDRYTNDTDVDIKILKNKIENINAPTNQQKLMLPFSLLSLQISAIDKQAILHRNDFLHGNINLKPRSHKAVPMDLYEVSLRLIMLIHLIIMKTTGFNGYIVNHPKIQGKTNAGDEEDFYRLI